MPNTATCKTCSHFDAHHGMCSARVISTHVGPSFAKRTEDSPACWSNYCRKTIPGEISDLFAQNQISTSPKAFDRIRAQKLSWHQTGPN